MSVWRDALNRKTYNANSKRSFQRKREGSLMQGLHEPQADLQALAFPLWSPLSDLQTGIKRFPNTNRHIL